MYYIHMHAWIQDKTSSLLSKQIRGLSSNQGLEYSPTSSSTLLNREGCASLWSQWRSWVCKSFAGKSIHDQFDDFLKCCFIPCLLSANFQVVSIEREGYIERGACWWWYARRRYVYRSLSCYKYKSAIAPECYYRWLSKQSPE